MERKLRWERQLEMAVARAQDDAASIQNLNRLDAAEHDLLEARAQLAVAKANVQENAESANGARDATARLEAALPQLQERVASVRAVQSTGPDSVLAPERAAQLHKNLSRYLIELREFRQQIDLFLRFHEANQEVERYIIELRIFLQFKQGELLSAPDKATIERVEREIKVCLCGPAHA